MGPTVLIVDDHASFRASARRMLESEGFAIAGEAANGRDAIQAASALRPDVVLLDVQLPDTNGIELAGQIVNAGGDPAIVLTSSRSVEEIGGIDGCGARGFIAKDQLSGAAIQGLIG